MIAALLLSSTMLAATIPPKPLDKPFLVLASGVYVAGASDWYTTKRALSEGYVEANPLVPENSAAFATLKVGMGTATNLYALHLKKNGKKWWWVPQATWIAFNLAAARHNYMLVEDEP